MTHIWKLHEYLQSRARWTLLMLREAWQMGEWQISWSPNLVLIHFSQYKKAYLHYWDPVCMLINTCSIYSASHRMDCSDSFTCCLLSGVLQYCQLCTATSIFLMELLAFYSVAQKYVIPTYSCICFHLSTKSKNNFDFHVKPYWS